MGKSRATPVLPNGKASPSERRSSDRLRPSNSTNIAISPERTAPAPRPKSRRAPRSHPQRGSSNSDTEEEEEQTLWEVERVVGKRFDEEGQVDYCLKWKNWSGEPTWEPQDNCDCKDLIDTFERGIARRQAGAAASAKTR